SNAYDGSRLVQRGDVVVVTVNHRLNIFAHLYLAEYSDKFAHSGNVGILDLVQSLEWVRDNIEAFGGDPDNVLIFGESGGGMKVSVLMAMDQADGLFHRAVVQSGPQLSNRVATEAAAGARAVVEQLGLDEQTIDQILTLPPEQIEAAAAAVVEAGGSYTWNGPVFDGSTFTRQPFEGGAPAQTADVPLLIGTTRTEMSLLAGARNPDLFDLTWESLPPALKTFLPDADIDALVQGYRALDPKLTAPMLVFEALTDNGFLRRSIELADQKALQKAAPVYFYFFNWDTPVDEGKWGATHALNIGFVFDNVARSASMSGTGEAQQAIADMMAESWLAFARNGNPANSTLPDWPAYTVEGREMMVIDSVPAVVAHPRGAQMDLLGN
ncbi:MAG: carboxylesterase family protein, partial [Proteobacteria bacterium]|nr:carboxylesterase family protein [Pseudomonadota bacterium]